MRGDERRRKGACIFPWMVDVVHAGCGSIGCCGFGLLKILLLLEFSRLSVGVATCLCWYQVEVTETDCFCVATYRSCKVLYHDDILGLLLAHQVKFTWRYVLVGGRSLSSNIHMLSETVVIVYEFYLKSCISVKILDFLIIFNFNENFIPKNK